MRARLLILLLTAGSLGCGGAEFSVAASDDGGNANDASDATVPADSNAPPGDSGPARDSGSVDSSTPDSSRLDSSANGDSSLLDSSADSSADSSMSGDSSADDAGDAAPDGGDAGPPVFTTCAAASTESTFVFCSDFDLEEGDSGPPWNWTPPALATVKAMNATDSTIFVSPPNSYAATTQALIPTDSANFATVSEPFSTMKTHVTYAFDVYVKKLGVGASFPIAQIISGAPGLSNRLFIYLFLDGSGLSLQQLVGEPDGGTNVASSPVTGSLGASWTHVEMDVDRSVNPANLSVLINGSLAGSAVALTPAGAYAMQVGLGILLVVPTCGANAINFDNAIVHAHD